jgi:hypothetical protein
MRRLYVVRDDAAGENHVVAANSAPDAVLAAVRLLGESRYQTFGGDRAAPRLVVLRTEVVGTYDLQAQEVST